MSKAFRFGSAASLAAFASIVAGCATPQKFTSFGGRANGEIGLATRALAALNANDARTAISFAERAVEKTPDDAGFRALLGNAYFAGGRFPSAEAAFKDALTIYPNQPQVVLKLALVEIALGKTDNALAALQAGQALLDPADYGLALALAGHARDAVPVLEAAAREPGAAPRVRQNLALAHALAGNWTEARTIAAQDVSADQLDGRIQQWMQLAKPTKASDQVAALVGVTPATVDHGQPVRLALRKSDARVAQTASPAVPKAAFAAPSRVAEPPASSAPVEEHALAIPPAAPPPNPNRKAAARGRVVPAPVPLAVMAAVAPEAPPPFATFEPRKPAPAAKPAKVQRAAASAPARAGMSKAVVQLGAYSSPQRVTAAWNELTRKYPVLRDYVPVRARFDSPKGTVWRLAIQGFGSQRDAIASCRQLRSRGGSCFVRNSAGDAPVQYASR